MSVIINTTNRILRLTSAFDIVKHWGFFNEARLALNDPSKARESYTELEFFNMCTKATNLPNDDGFVVMLTSKNGKPLGCGVAFAAEDFNGKRCFYVWCTYTNGKCTTALQELLHHAERHARSLGYREIKMSTRRINGGAMRLFEDKLGFEREFVAFTKSI